MAKTVIFGNEAPTEPVKLDPNKTATKQVDLDGGPRETVYAFPDDMGLDEILLNVKRSWENEHSREAPSFVESSDPTLQAALASLYEPTQEGRAKGWSGARVLPPLEGGSHEWDEHSRLYLPKGAHEYDPFFSNLVGGFVRNARFLRTDAGKDFQSRVMGDTASTGTGSYAAATYIALTANSTAPAAGNTTLAGEITTAGGGLLRAQAAYAHTAGASTYTLIKTFTANGSDALPVTVAKIGVFNASSTGTLVFETLLNAMATLSASGDQVQVTETVTI